jgi:hypothetical protein
MYCVKCGVELGNTEKKCPLCGTPVWNPDSAAEELYPRYRYGRDAKPKTGLMFLFTFILLIPVLLCLLIDLKLNRRIVWSGYVSLSAAVVYIMLVLPFWFRKRNPVIFVPVSFAAACGLLLYICCKSGGKWFLSFAFPVTGALCLIVTAAVALYRYAPKGWIFTTGGLTIALGGLSILIEFFLHITFGFGMFVWSLYPAAVLLLFGLLIIAIGTSPSMRAALRKKMFF